MNSRIAKLTLIEQKVSNAFITEDLTQVRYKPLNYAKTKCNDRFVMCNSYDNKIRMKEAGKKKKVDGL